MRKNRSPIRSIACATAAGLLGLPPTQAAPEEAPVPVVTYTPEGQMRFPSDYREWVYLSAGLDMSYEARGTPRHSVFDNVFVDRPSYAAFLATGTWPEHTTLVLEIRPAASKASINVRGQFQTGGRVAIEVHVKDSQRFPGGWAFFGFSGESPAAALPTSESCYSCHAQHGAVDTTFVQFYPTLLPIAQKHGTVKPEG